MAIRVVCSCGHAAQADEALVHRWIRCAGCGKLLQVRRGRAEGRGAAPPASGPRPAPPPIPPASSNVRPSLPESPGRAGRGGISPARVGLASAAATLVIVLAGIGIYAARGRSGMEATRPIPDMTDIVRRVPKKGHDGDARPIAAEPAKPPAVVTPAKPTIVPTQAKVPIADGHFSTREIVARCEAAVVRIDGRFGTGSGFLAGPGLVATNAHVVDGEIPGDLRVFFPSRGELQKGPYRATLVVDDVPRDLAILKVDVPFPPLPLAAPYRFRRGEDVTIIGSPGVGQGMLTLENAVCRGVLSIETVILGQKYYQIGASVNPGNSGGPVIDSKGEVIGVVESRANKEESIGFCIPVDDVTAAIDRARNAAPDEIRTRASHHGASAVYRSVIGRASLCVLALEALSKRIDAILQRRLADAEDLTDTLQTSKDRLVLCNASFDDGYRVAVSELLNDPDLPADVRRDLRDLWSTCDDMSRLALDSRPNFGRFSMTATSLMTHFGDLVGRLKKELAPGTP